MKDNQASLCLLRPNANPGWGFRRPFLWFALIFALAFLYRLVAISQLSAPPVNDLLWNDAVAWNLAQGNGFTASQGVPLVPGVLRTPGYPAFLAVVYYLFGHSYTAAFVFQALVDALSAVLITLIGLRLMSPGVALTGGILYATYPYSAFFCGVLSQDILLTLTVLVVLYLTARVDPARPRLSQWLLVGLAIGAAALVKSFMILLALVPALLVLLVVSGVRRRIAALAMVGIGAALMVSPWVVRNYVVFRSFPPLAVGGTGSNLRLILVELEGGEQALINQLTPPRFDPAVSSRYLDEFVDGAALIARERDLFRQSYPEIIKRWPRYLLVSLGHIPRLWLTKHTIGHGSTTATIAFGLSLLYLIPAIVGIFLARSRWRQLLPALGGIIVVTLIYAPYTAEARYTLPVRPVMMLFVASTIHFVVARLRTPGRNRNLVASMANERGVASGSRDGAEGRMARRWSAGS
jgi:4-amino-4-deoxy-L-arabinose transferase-like glycosyltransferase